MTGVDPPINRCYITITVNITDVRTKISHLCSKMKPLRNLPYLLVLPLLALLMQCANPVMPTGGPRDEAPPRVVESDPPNFSTNFSGRTISITFNEFVSLKGLQQQLLISPPLDERPEFRLRGRTLQVRLFEDLKPETTYNIYFGDAIVDLTESNPLSDFSFIFSTGSALDSMDLSGNIRFAYDLKPPESAFAMLYLIDNDTLPLDSLPYLVKPYYVTRTDKEGNFRFRNLKNERFKLFGLTDMNSNFRYDMAGEAIAFFDSLVKPAFFEPLADSVIFADSLIMQEIPVLEDTLANELTFAEQAVIDSLVMEMEAERRSLKAFYQMYMFKEVDSTQRLLRTEVVKPGLLQFAFRYPAYNVTVEPLEDIPNNMHLLRQFNKTGDTLQWYFRTGVKDSLQVLVQFDTLINDTLHLSLAQRLAPGLRRADRVDDKPASLDVKPNTSNRQLEIFRPLILSFDYPVIKMQMRDTTRFIANEDTLFNAIAFERFDSIGLKYKMLYEFEPEGNYRILIPDSCFHGLNDTWNDTIILNFRVPAISDYGNLYVDIVIPDDEVFILQLLNSRGDVVRQKPMRQSGRYSFEYLPAGKFRLKAIHDRNRNGRWDTGDYLKGIQPERVYIFSKEIEVRANWDFEEDWDILSDF